MDEFNDRHTGYAPADRPGKLRDEVFDGLNQ